jgi:hypothetical protein
MGRLVRNLKSFSGAMLSTVVILIGAFFVLNFIAQRGWGPLSAAAGWAESHANGSAYDGGAAAPLAGIPSSGNGPAF